MSTLAILHPPVPGARVRQLITPARAAAALALLSLAIALIHLGGRPLWLDEAYSAWFSSRGWHDLWTVVPTYETHPPLYYSLLKGWSAIAGASPFALRLPSVLLGAATVLIASAAALEIDRQDDVHRPLLRMSIAAFLCACSPMFIYLDQQARPYALMVFAYSLATLAVARLIGEFRSGPGSWRSWALLAGGTELTLWSHSLGVLYAASIAVALAPAWLSRAVDRQRIVRGIATLCLVTLVYVPCLVMVAGRTGDWHTSWLTWGPFKLLELFGLYSIPVEALTIVAAPAAVIMLLLVKRAIQHDAAGRGWTLARTLLVLWWAPTLLTVGISAMYIPIYLPRTLAATLVPAYLALSGALARSNSSRERLVLAAALVLTLLPTAIQTALRPGYERWPEVAAYLDRAVAPVDQVWLYPNDSVLPLHYADPKASYRVRELPAAFPAVAVKGVNRSGSPSTPSLTPKQAEAVAADPAVRSVPTIWLVTRSGSIFDPDKDLPRALAEHRRPGKAQRWGYIVVQPFTRR